ncbi:c2h2 finger domain-containing protein [Hypoxylon sp. NC1633]|nr:c2h2 finger domain-containing protein [Hypoxylon sp. NC1633]
MANQSTKPSNVYGEIPLGQCPDILTLCEDEDHTPEEETTKRNGDESEELLMTGEWDTTQCLFCNIINADFDANLDHMSNGHGLFIPERQGLVVDLETLVGYFHFVIFAYRECLYCGSQKTSREAVQSHMRDKGHCKFDISNEDSEYRDFYDLASDDGHRGINSKEGEQDVPANTVGNRASLSPVQVDEGFVRLPSGKVLAQRSYRAPRPHRPLSNSQGSLPSSSHPEPTPDSSDVVVIPSSKGALSKAQKRDLAVDKQLGNLRSEDRQQLIHLPAHEQRAVLATQKQQLDKQRRTEQWIRSRVERKGNKTLMKHFVNDVPGRLNG